MSKIDVSGWGEFKVGNLFEQVKTKKVPFKALDLPQSSNDIQTLPLVAAGVDDQGRNCYVEPKYATVLNNCLTVSANGANSGTVFYQDSDFSILQDAYALRLANIYSNYRKSSIYLFLASILTNTLVNNDWTNKATWRKVQKKTLKLPITSTGNPDWQYMDSYIAELATRAHRDVSLLNRVEPKRHQINISGWKEFKVGDLLNFDSSKQIYHAENLDILDKPADNSYHPYVVRSGFNNGIRGYINENPNTLNPGNTISFAQDTAQLFYQTEPYFTGNKIKICSLKDEQELTKPISLFLIASLLKSFSMFSWDSSFNVTTLKRVKIKLPITSDGKPAWDYMDNYVTNLTTRTFRDVNSLRMLTGM